MAKEDIRLVRTIRNQVFIRVEASGIEPAHFRWDEVDLVAWSGMYQYSVQASKLVHAPSGFYYQFGPHTDKFSPGHLERIGS